MQIFISCPVIHTVIICKRVKYFSAPAVKKSKKLYMVSTNIVKSLMLLSATTTWECYQHIRQRLFAQVDIVSWLRCRGTGAEGCGCHVIITVGQITETGDRDIKIWTTVIWQAVVDVALKLVPLVHVVTVNQVWSIRNSFIQSRYIASWA